ncbi:IGS10 protein, partial [Psophia crepitans]|nr:IGS10 protein [Psophia crepitans]
EDGRIVVVKAGTFTLRTADTFDTGLYHCVGTNYNDADTLTFRITVVDPHVEHNSVNGAQLSAVIGSTLYLPCTATAVPDAAVSWVLPEHEILRHSVRNKHVFDNGTLRIEGVTERDRGYFRCVAANRYGVDLLIFQVLVRKDETPLRKKHVAAGGWEEGDGSGNAMLAAATTQEHPPATRATLTADQDSAASASRNRVTQSARERNGYGKMTYRHYRDRTSRRFRGHRRQFVSSARRVDPQRWAAFLEKTKRNSTLIEKRGEVATKPPLQVRKFSEGPGDEEETSGDLMSPEEEFMIPVTETATVSTLGTTVTAGPQMTASNTLAGKAFLLGAEAVAPFPSPLSQPVSSNSGWPQTHQNPTIIRSWERSDLSKISGNGMEQSTVSNGASGTPTLFPAGQTSVYSGESNKQPLKSVSTTPVTNVTDTSKSVTSQTLVDKLHLFTESVGKIATKTDHPVSAVTVGEPSPGFGHIYIHVTQKQVTPKPPLASTTVAHQHTQITQDVTTRTAQAQQQYGRRRKISGRRRIVRPGRIPSMKERRYKFGRPGSARGSTAAAADVQVNMKYVSNLPTLNNLSRSVNPFSPEAPLSPPSTMTVPLEHPAGTHQNAALLREEENEAGSRPKAAPTVAPFVATGTQDTPQRELESSAPFQTNADRVQPLSIRPPPTAIHTTGLATAITNTISTEISSTLESVSRVTKPRISPKNTQREKITWEHLFGNGAQKEALKKVPNQETDEFPSGEVSTTLPKTMAAFSTSKMSPLRFTPISMGGSLSGGFLSLNKPIKSEEHLPTAKPHSYSSLATSAANEMDVTSLRPTVIPVIAPQTETTITHSKTFRAGRRRGQRRRRPPKTATAESMAAGHGTAAVPSGNSALPVLTTGKPLSTSPAPPEPLSEGTSAALVTDLPPSGPEAPQHVPAAAAQTSATPITRRNIPSATLPPDSRIAQSPAAPSQAAPRLSEPFEAASARPAAGCATSGSEPARETTATTTVAEKSHPKTEERVLREHGAAQPAFPARTESSTRAPAATTDIAPPGALHPALLP